MESRPAFAAAVQHLPGGLGQFSSLLDRAPFGVYVDDPTLGCTYANEALLRQFGVSWQEFRGFGWARHVIEEDAVRLRDRIQTYETKLEPIHVSYRTRGASGEVRWIHARVEPILDGDGRHIGSIGITQDRTMERKFEERAARAQKLEAIGRLSARVAHDFNNLLTPMLFSLERLSGSCANSHARDLKVLQASVDRARALTKQLLLLSRHRVSTHDACDIDEEVRRMSTILERTLGEGIDLFLNLQAPSAVAPMDAGRFGQVVLNLATNGADAMSGYGRLTIRTYRVGDKAVLEVEDVGAGMTEEVRARATEPFFTTKAAGRGTGLGLSTVADLVNLAGGKLEFVSAPGQGARVCVELPLLDRAAPKPHRGAGPVLEKLGEGLTVLLIEDEDALRQSLAYALALQGFAVLTAASLQEAQMRWADNHAIDLLVTDVMLPDGRSPDLVEPLRRERPDLFVLYMSGYAGEDTLGLGDRTSFLEKPFGPVAFTTAVAQLLRSPKDS